MTILRYPNEDATLEEVKKHKKLITWYDSLEPKDVDFNSKKIKKTIRNIINNKKNFKQFEVFLEDNYEAMTQYFSTSFLFKNSLKYASDKDSFYRKDSGLNIPDLKTEIIEATALGVGGKNKNYHIGDQYAISLFTKIDDYLFKPEKREKIEHIINSMAFSNLYIAPLILESFFENDFNEFGLINDWEHKDFYLRCNREQFYDGIWTNSIQGNQNNKIEDIVYSKKILNYFLNEFPEDLDKIFPFKWKSPLK